MSLFKYPDFNWSIFKTIETSNKPEIFLLCSLLLVVVNLLFLFYNLFFRFLCEYNHFKNVNWKIYQSLTSYRHITEYLWFFHLSTNYSDIICMQPKGSFSQGTWFSDLCFQPNEASNHCCTGVCWAVCFPVPCLPCDFWGACFLGLSLTLLSTNLLWLLMLKRALCLPLAKLAKKYLSG